ncbi:MAG: hypothetical protein BV458_12690 [Thermoplasmata archaeon M9B2D]|nr:MAG: hypothetical protein BV458_12690 [Thermoplasmata archaeon M9B2D]
MNKKLDIQSNRKVMRELTSGAKQVLQEPILKILQNGSVLSQTQLETLLIDLVIEDNYGAHITYEDKASIRSRAGTKAKGVSRGAFNRTLKQARRNVTRCFYTMLLLTYLGLFELTIFRPFEEVAARIGDYRRIREILAGKSELTQEDLESVKVTERTIVSLLENLSLSLALKTDISRKRE